MPQAIFDRMTEVANMPREERRAGSAFGAPIGGVTRHFTRHNVGGFAGLSDRTGSDTPTSYAQHPTPTGRFVARADAIPIAMPGEHGDDGQSSAYGKGIGRRFHENNSLLCGSKRGFAFPTSRAEGAFGKCIEFRQVGGRDVPIAYRDCTDNTTLAFPTTLPWDCKLQGPTVYDPTGGEPADGIGRRVNAGVRGIASYLAADESGIAMNQYQMGANEALGVYRSKQINQTVQTHAFRSGSQNDSQGVPHDFDALLALGRFFECTLMSDYTSFQIGQANIRPDVFFDAASWGVLLRNELSPPVAGQWAPDVYFLTQAWDQFIIDGLDVAPLSVPANVIMGYSQLWTFDGGTTAERNNPNSGKFHNTGELIEWCILTTCGNGFPPNASNIITLFSFKHAGSINDLSKHFHQFFYMCCPSHWDTVVRGNYSMCPQYVRHCTIPGRNEQVEYIGDEIIWDPTPDPNLINDYYHSGFQPNRTQANERMGARMMSRWKDGIPGGEVEFRNLSFNFAVSARDVSDIHSHNDINEPNRDWGANDLGYIQSGLPAQP
jgi:hypothetical protein